MSAREKLYTRSRIIIARDEEYGQGGKEYEYLLKPTCSIETARGLIIDLNQCLNAVFRARLVWEEP